MHEITYKHEDQPAILVQRLLNDPSIGARISTEEIKKLVYACRNLESSSFEDFVDNLWETILKREGIRSLQDCLNNLLLRGDVEIIFIDERPDSTILVSWLNMFGGIVLDTEYNSWHLHT